MVPNLSTKWKHFIPLPLSHPAVFYKKDLVKNLQKFPEKHLPKLATVLKKKLRNKNFLCNFADFLQLFRRSYTNGCFCSLILIRIPHKTVKNTQTIRRQELTNCLNMFDDFMGLALKELIQKFNKLPIFVSSAHSVNIPGC